MFSKMAADEYATIVDADYDSKVDDDRMRLGLAQAGWSEREINQRLESQKAILANSPVTSSGVAPHVEVIFSKLCDDIEAAMSRLKMDSYARIARGIEPRTGPHAALTNVILTDQSIVSVGSFLFRFCGLVARAFTRTLHLNPWLWEDAGYSETDARRLLRDVPELLVYWLKIFVSFAVTGTQIMTVYKPANKNELILFEQVARAMEIFAIAHEYGHHHYGHGRQLDLDSKSEEFSADQFALLISYEVERKPFLFSNPYLSSGAGGLVLLLSLEILKKFTQAIIGVPLMPSGTHPKISERLDRFNSVAVLKPDEFLALKGFRTTSHRLMTSVDSELSNLLTKLTPDLINQLRTLARPY